MYGFLISRYSSQNDVTDMDSEHISNRFLEDIQYACQETCDQIIKIDNLIYLELHCEISKVLLGVIRCGMASINDHLKEERNRNQVSMGCFHCCHFVSPVELNTEHTLTYNHKDGK